MTVSVFSLVGLLLWACAGGSSSQTVPVMVQTNHDLLLTVTEQKVEKSDIFYWKFNNGNSIVQMFANRITLNNDYKDRVEFFPQNLSLILKRVQLNDSGIYTALLSWQTERTVAGYDVKVQAPVSPVWLRVDSVSLGSESCNFTVSCTTEYSSISRSFTCDRHTCEEALGPAHFGPFSLSLYLSNMSVICYYSNDVSWTKGTQDIQQVCIGQPGAEPEPVVSWCELKTIVFTVGLLLMTSALISVHVLECIKKKNN